MAQGPQRRGPGTRGEDSSTPGSSRVMVSMVAPRAVLSLMLLEFRARLGSDASRGGG